MATTGTLKIRRKIPIVRNDLAESQPVNVGDENGIDEPISASESVSVEVDSPSDSGPELVNPADIGGNESTSSESGQKRRGRPKGSKNGITKTKDTAQDLGAVLYSIHLMMALTLAPEIAISQENANELAAAIARVNELYGGIIIPPHVLAWINLATVGSKIYGPRAYAIYKRVSSDKPKTDPELQTITFPNGSNGVN